MTESAVFTPTIEDSAGAPTQRAFMRDLVLRFGVDEEAVCAEYARAEERGEVFRRKNDYCRSSLRYARALWRDGMRRGWLYEAKVLGAVTRIEA